VTASPTDGAARARAGPRRLEGRVTVVTGAAKGLGAGIAVRLAAEGASVTCVDLLDSASVLARLAPPPEGRRHAAEVFDVADVAEADRLVQRVIDREGRIDVLVNNAAVIQPVRPLVDTPDETIDRVLRVNLRGPIALCRAAGRRMQEQRAGRIVNIASQVAKVPWKGLAVYSASKAGVIALTQALALELAEYGVLVNAVVPGTMLTDQMRSSFRDLARAAGGDVEALIREKADAMPLGRLGAPEDAGAMVAWLASDDASFTTGAALNLTGGECVAF
jgi:NAD(P)-dependent dehydrogenase (short-subunit alcohol dehydrogenase family)